MCFTREELLPYLPDILQIVEHPNGQRRHPQIWCHYKLQRIEAQKILLEKDSRKWMSDR
jgi:hypothetical protein